MQKQTKYRPAYNTIINAHSAWNESLNEWQFNFNKHMSNTAFSAFLAELQEPKFCFDDNGSCSEYFVKHKKLFNFWDFVNPAKFFHLGF